MKHGDFTKLAKHYINRPGYSLNALYVISNHIKCKLNKSDLFVADVGAGTGKLTENLSQMGFSGFAIEPNDAMREEGMQYTLGKSFKWIKGSAEITTLPDNCVDWVLMGSSFHWTEIPVALEEFSRILVPGGFFTAIWNPRDIDKSQFHKSIEEKINKIVPDIKRISSGSAENMQGMDEKILSTDFFCDLFFIEVPHTEIMSKERYIGAWKSVNDIRVQAGEERFQAIIEMIEKEILSMDNVETPYKSRAWTVQAKKTNT